MASKQTGEQTSDANIQQRMRKKRRFAREEAEIASRQADGETALEVDIMILDYQAYMTTRVLLQQAGMVAAYHVDNVRANIMATDAFLTSFQQRHPQYSADDALRLRLLLLQFCALYTHRYMRDESVMPLHELHKLRNQRTARVRRWIARLDRIPTNGHDTTLLEATPALSLDRLTATRESVLDALQVRAGGARTHYGSNDSISLLDLLPKFMELCAFAHKARHQLNITAVMRLMTEFMLQASLEQYLVYGANDTVDPVDEAFAWGCFADELSDEQSIHPSDIHNKTTSSSHDGAIGDMMPSSGGAKYSTPHESDSTSGQQIASDATRPPDADSSMRLSQHSTPRRAGIGPSADNDRQVERFQHLSEAERAIDSMFRDSHTGQESKTWRDAKKFMLDELLQLTDESESALTHLERVAALSPVQDFDMSLRGFLQHFAKLIGLPILAQVEQGQFTGLTKHETKSFLRSCGVFKSGRCSW